LVFDFAKALGEVVRSSPCHLVFGDGTSRIRQRHTKRVTKLHLAPRVLDRSGRKNSECLLYTSAALFQQRQIHPQGEGYSCKRNSKHLISAQGKCPIKR